MEVVFDKVSYIHNYGTPLEKTLLKNIDMTIEENTISAILGNSNSGKTAVGELINAVVSPTFGTVKIGEFINENKRRIKNIDDLRFDVGFVLRDTNDMLFNKTVKEELEFGLNYFKYKTDRKALRVQEALFMVGLNDSYIDKEITSLTLAEKKKVCLASVLIFNPKILILDEPTVGLNFKEKGELKRLILILKQKYNRTIIILSKDTTFVYDVCEYVYILNKSILVYSGKVDILTNSKMLETYGLKVPGIIKFIELSKAKGIELENYKDVQDLIKAIYRELY